MKRGIRLLALLLALVLFVSCNGAEEKPQGGTENGGEAEERGYQPVIPEVMPEVYITTEDGDNSWATKYSFDDKLEGLIEYTDACVTVTSCSPEYEFFDAEAEVKVRGNHTMNYDKKPIRIKFKEKSNMLGMHGGEAYKSWVLLCEWKDPSLMRNALSFYLGNAILGEDGYYCTDFRTVGVYLNDEYWGVYLLVEQQEVKDGRTSVPEVEKGYEGTDIGYFFEYDGYYKNEQVVADGDPIFEMTYGGGRNGMRGYTVKSDIYSQDQLDFLKNYLDNVYTIVYRANYQNRYYKFNEDKTAIVPDTACRSAEEAVSNVIDIDSLVDTYILNELVCDLDVDYSSFYFSLDMTEEGDGWLVFEAPWDFDSAFGIWNGMCTDAVGMYAMERGNPWFSLFDGVVWFEDCVEDKWAEIKAEGVLDTAKSMLVTMEQAYHLNYLSNHKRWQARLTEGHAGVIQSLDKMSDYKTAHALASEHLKKWFSKRVEYLDGVWSKK